MEVQIVPVCFLHRKHCFISLKPWNLYRFKRKTFNKRINLRPRFFSFPATSTWLSGKVIYLFIFFTCCQGLWEDSAPKVTHFIERTPITSPICRNVSARNQGCITGEQWEWEESQPIAGQLCGGFWRCRLRTREGFVSVGHLWRDVTSPDTDGRSGTFCSSLGLSWDAWLIISPSTSLVPQPCPLPFNSIWWHNSRRVKTSVQIGWSVRLFELWPTVLTVCCGVPLCFSQWPSGEKQDIIVRTLCCSSETHHGLCCVSSVWIGQVKSTFSWLDHFPLERGRTAREIFLRAETWGSTGSCLLVHYRTVEQLSCFFYTAIVCDSFCILNVCRIDLKICIVSSFY